MVVFSTSYSVSPWCSMMLSLTNVQVSWASKRSVMDCWSLCTHLEMVWNLSVVRPKCQKALMIAALHVLMINSVRVNLLSYVWSSLCARCGWQVVCQKWVCMHLSALSTFIVTTDSLKWRKTRIVKSADHNIDHEFQSHPVCSCFVLHALWTSSKYCGSQSSVTHPPSKNLAP